MGYWVFWTSLAVSVFSTHISNEVASAPNSNSMPAGPATSCSQFWATECCAGWNAYAISQVSAHRVFDANLDDILNATPILIVSVGLGIICSSWSSRVWLPNPRGTHSAHAGHFYANPSHPTKSDTSGNAMPQRLHLLCVLVTAGIYSRRS